MAEPGNKKGSLLGAAAYLLIPGERRVKAAGHFRKAGFEALKGIGALASREEPLENQSSRRRQSIEID